MATPGWTSVGVPPKGPCEPRGSDAHSLLRSARALPDAHPNAPLRVVVVSEQDLSHGDFIRAFAGRLRSRPDVTTDLQLVEDPRGLERLLLAGVPGVGHLDLQPLRWRLRYSLRTRRILRRAVDVADVALVHTQACALGCRRVMRRIPTVLSVDVTARQWAALEYLRPRGRTSAAGEAPLNVLERRAYADAAGVLAWSEWTACSLRKDYGVPAERISVLHPGVDVAGWSKTRAARPGGPLRLLFVGNDVWRKGLRTLLDALSVLGPRAHLDIVTHDAVEPAAGVAVHAGLQPSSDEVRGLYAAADVFVFPTRADAVPWAVLEAMAAGLPVVASGVGAIPEILGGTGWLIPPGDVGALVQAVDSLADDPALRARLGDHARRRVEESYDQERQLPRIVDVLRAASLSFGSPRSTVDGGSSGR